MDEDKATSILQWYESIEEQIIEYCKYVPPQGQNMRTWSPRLATVITESCGLIDSLLRHISPQRVKIHGKEKKREELTFHDYGELYSTKLKLPYRKVIMLTTPPEYRTPFEVWLKIGTGGSVSPPTWWTTNNDLKHNRIDCFVEATLERAIDALAGSLLVIGGCSDLIPALVRQGWIDIKGWNPEIVIEGIRKGDEGTIVLTSLFALWLGNMPLPDNIDNFSPIKYGHSTKLAAFFGRF